MVEKVVTGSSAILSGRMSDFFKMPSVVADPTPRTRPSSSGSSATNAANSDELAQLARTFTIVDYGTAPTCPFPLSKANSRPDGRGRFLSAVNGRVCVFRPTADIPRPETKWYTWDSAQACLGEPTESNSVADEIGRLWGWQDNNSCGFKNQQSAVTAETPAVPSARVGAGTEAELPSRVSLVWDAAPACSFTPTKTNAMADNFGRLWSWENGNSCAFKVGAP